MQALKKRNLKHAKTKARKKIQARKTCKKIKDVRHVKKEGT